MLVGPTLYNDLHVWVQGKQELLQYANHHTPQSLFLTQGFGEGLFNPLHILVSRFEPGPRDRTTYFWTDRSGHPRSMEMPPYFISDLDAARQSIRMFLSTARSPYIDSLLADSNPIVCKTFQAALTFVAFGQASTTALLTARASPPTNGRMLQSKLVSEALDIWVAARFIETHWRVFCGGPSIGLEPTNEPDHPYDGFIPVTPMMDTQLDDLFIRDLLAPLTTRFLARLKAKIEEGKRQNWQEIYFALFITMSNIGWIIKDMVVMTKWKGLKVGVIGFFCLCLMFHLLINVPTMAYIT